MKCWRNNRAWSIEESFWLCAYLDERAEVVQCASSALVGVSYPPGDFEGVAKFILDMHLSMYRERNECHVERGCGSLNPWGCNLALERPDFH